MYIKECKNPLHLLKYQVAGVFHMHFGMYKETLFKKCYNVRVSLMT